MLSVRQAAPRKRLHDGIVPISVSGWRYGLLCRDRSAIGVLADLRRRKQSLSSIFGVALHAPAPMIGSHHTATLMIAPLK